MSQRTLWKWECIVPGCDLPKKYADRVRWHSVRSVAKRGGRNHLEKFHGIYGEEPILIHKKEGD